MGRLKDIMSAFIPTAIMLGIIGSAVLIYGVGNKAQAKRKAERFSQAQVLEGKVIKEGYYAGTGGGCAGSTRAAYNMVVEMPDGSRRTFTYSGAEARLSDTEYDVGDEARFREGFRPGDNF